jgi:hypothetical protein
MIETTVEFLRTYLRFDGSRLPVSSESLLALAINMKFVMVTEYLCLNWETPRKSKEDRMMGIRSLPQDAGMRLILEYVQSRSRGCRTPLFAVSPL